MKETRIEIFQFDSFTDGPFTGNPAAVCPLDDWLTDEQMIGIASENNLAETAFLVRRDDSGYDLRWFSPMTEVDLCGHATLASGRLVLSRLEPEREDVKFYTRSGMLGVWERDGRYVMDFPSNPPAPLLDHARAAAVGSALGAAPAAVLTAGVYVCVFNSAAEVREIKPDFSAMAGLDLPWVSVTAASDERGIDFISRFFAPGSGIPEDAATGSAHTWLTPYWSARLGKTTLIARQVSTRGGLFWCRDEGDRVEIAGRVTDYLEGHIIVPGS